MGSYADLEIFARVAAWLACSFDFQLPGEFSHVLHAHRSCELYALVWEGDMSDPLPRMKGEVYNTFFLFYANLKSNHSELSVVL